MIDLIVDERSLSKRRRRNAFIPPPPHSCSATSVRRTSTVCNPERSEGSAFPLAEEQIPRALGMTTGCSRNDDHGTYAIQSISTRKPTPGSAAA
jgi:hypothetical protein